MTVPLLEASGLRKHFVTEGGVVRAVDDVSFAVYPGETVGMVGESGCGKSTVGRTILWLIEPTAGSLFFEGENILAMEKSRRQKLRRKMGIVFQDPYSALNPRMKVVDIIGEPLKAHEGLRGGQIRERAAALLTQVGLEPDHLHLFPHQFSGGQRQRIAVARSIAVNPRFLILDEPTSALDVSVQAQVLNLIRTLQRRHRLTYLFITHDLNVVYHTADRILVMYLGKIVESGPVEAVFETPLHPYTRALLDAAPDMNKKTHRKRTLLEGDIPSPIDPPPGCRFHTRCPLAAPICRQTPPEFVQIGDHRAACHRIDPPRNPK